MRNAAELRQSHHLTMSFVLPYVSNRPAWLTHWSVSLRSIKRSEKRRSALSPAFIRYSMIAKPILPLLGATTFLTWMMNSGHMPGGKTARDALGSFLQTIKSQLSWLPRPPPEHYVHLSDASWPATRAIQGNILVAICIKPRHVAYTTRHE